MLHQIIIAETVGIEGLVSQLSAVLMYVFAAVGAVSSIFAVYLGFMLAKAEDASKRKLAKKRILNVLSGLFIIIILLTVMLSLELQFNDVGPTNYAPNIVIELPQYEAPPISNPTFDEVYSGDIWETSPKGTPLPSGANFIRGEGGSNNRNPRNYQISTMEMVLMARVIQAEAGGCPYITQLAVAEVIMRRVMSADFSPSQNTVYAVILNGYSTFDDAMSGRRTATANSTKAAAHALQGISNVSLGAYRQGQNLKKYLDDERWNVFEVPKPVKPGDKFEYFANNPTTAKYKLQDFRDVT